MNILLFLNSTLKSYFSRMLGESVFVTYFGFMITIVLSCKQVDFGPLNKSPRKL